VDNLKETSAAFAETEQGGAALETGLLLALAAASAFTLRYLVLSPLLANFTKATRALSQALG